VIDCIESGLENVLRVLNDALLAPSGIPNEEGIMGRRRLIAVVLAFLLGSGILGCNPKLSAAQATDTCSYVASMLTMGEMMAWFYDEASVLTTDFETSDLMDEQWRVDVIGLFSVPRAVQAQLRTIEPPPEYEDSHSYYVEGIDETVIAGEYMNDGVLNMDAAAIGLATEHLTRSTELINLSAEALPGT
jgi:hypothetical protein